MPQTAVPTIEAARTLARQGNLIPVYRELLADMETPVSVYRKIARGSYSFLLARVEGGERVFERRFADPLDFVRDLLAPYRPVPLPDMPRFQGGAVGYLAYECVRYF